MSALSAHPAAFLKLFAADLNAPLAAFMDEFGALEQGREIDARVASASICSGSER